MKPVAFIIDLSVIDVLGKPIGLRSPYPDVL